MRVDTLFVFFPHLLFSEHIFSLLLSDLRASNCSFMFLLIRTGYVHLCLNVAYMLEFCFVFEDGSLLVFFGL